MLSRNDSLIKKIYGIENKDAAHLALDQILKGEVIALPTDTVYGLACDANNENAVKKLYAIKGRENGKPVAICVKSLFELRYFCVAEHLSDELLKQLLPGPTTVVLERSTHLNNRALNPNISKIGVRIPEYPFIREICTLFKKQPLALTSANKSHERSSLNIKEFEALWPQIGCVFDGGQIGIDEKSRSASTVIDLSLPGYYKLIRNGVALNRTLKIVHDFGLKIIK